MRELETAPSRIQGPTARGESAPPPAGELEQGASAQLGPLNSTNALAAAPSEAMLAEFAARPGIQVPGAFDHLPNLPGLPQWRLDYGPRKPEDVAAWAKDLLAKGVLLHDNETTGLSADKQTVEIGLVDSQGQLLFEERVRPTIAVEPAAAAVHGISEEALASARGFDEVGPEFFRALESHAVEGRVFVAAYSLPYDPETLASSAQAAGVQIPEHLEVIWADVMSAHQTLNLAPKGRSLSSAAAAAGVEIEGKAHSAVTDCQTTLGVLKAMAEERYGTAADLSKGGPKAGEVVLSLVTKYEKYLGHKATLTIDGLARRRFGLEGAYSVREEIPQDLPGRIKDALGSRLADRLQRGFSVRVPAEEVVDRIRSLVHPLGTGDLIKGIKDMQLHLEVMEAKLGRLDAKAAALADATAAGCSPEEALTRAGMSVSRLPFSMTVEIEPYLRVHMPVRDGADHQQDALRAIRLARLEAVDLIKTKMDALRETVAPTRIPDPARVDLSDLFLESKPMARVIEGPNQLLGLVEAAIQTHGVDVMAAGVLSEDASLTTSPSRPWVVGVEFAAPVGKEDWFELYPHPQVGASPMEADTLTLGALRDLVKEEIADRIKDAWSGLPDRFDYQKIDQAVMDLFPREEVPEIYDTIRDTVVDHLRRLADEIERV